ncbi:MAG: cellulase family glycosylhydrolase [Candidatus Eremiobacteraeota bacterium]|nr:cellulase family glycosylhydrolase [Candidatus Eremiobacteraeota bacterium]MBV8367219.1 cellulase family glycosylhydrolase [Candidatus Eremiobacteraeota bacterium]
MSEAFRLGVNYWPARSAMRWWSEFKRDEVARDFDRIRTSGCTCVRIFLLWEEFQPTAERASGKHLDMLRLVAQLAASMDLRLIVTLFTGHMSGANFIPPWALHTGAESGRFPTIARGETVRAQPRNWYDDEAIVDAQALLAQSVASALAGERAIWCYDLGNENSNCSVPPDEADGDAWLGRMAGAVRGADPGCLVTLGMHMEDLEEDRRITPATAARHCDFLCMHGYPMYASWAAAPDDARLLPFLAAITRRLGDKAVLFEEFGAPTFDEADPTPPGVPVLSEREAAHFTNAALDALRAYGTIGALVWDYADYDRSIWRMPPLDRAPHERHFGVWHADGSPKPARDVLLAHADDIREAPPADDWIDIEPARFYDRPKQNLIRLYARFCETRTS